MKKIACLGTHSVGKSTLSYKLASKHKALGENVYILQEQVRNSPYPINQSMVYETAIWTSTSQIAKELDVEQKGFSLLVCDRTAFDPFMYAAHYKLTGMECARKLAEAWMKTYDELYFVRPSSEHKPSEDGTRSTDEDFIYSVDRLFDSFLKEHKIAHTTIYTEDIFDVRNS